MHHIQLSLKVNGKGEHYHKVQKEVNSSEGAKTRVQEVMSRLSVKPARAYWNKATKGSRTGHIFRQKEMQTKEKRPGS